MVRLGLTWKAASVAFHVLISLGVKGKLVSEIIGDLYLILQKGNKIF